MLIEKIIRVTHVALQDMLSRDVLCMKIHGLPCLKRQQHPTTSRTDQFLDIGILMFGPNPMTLALVNHHCHVMP